MMQISIFHRHDMQIIAEIEIDERNLEERCVNTVGEALKTYFSRRKTLIDANLNGVVCRHAQLRGRRFIRCDLEGADLSDAMLDEADFSQANLVGVDFQNASLRNARFSLAHVARTNFAKANLEGAVFYEADVNDVTFQHSNLKVVGFDGARCQRVKFISTNLTETSWDAINAAEVTFRDAKWGSISIETVPEEIDGRSCKLTNLGSHVAIGGHLFKASKIHTLTTFEAISLWGLRGLQIRRALETLR